MRQWETKPTSRETDSQASSDCCMVAAESFCGMEQTTTRVKPVAVVTDPGCGLVPTIRES